MEVSDGRDGRFRALFEAEYDYLFATLRRLGVAPRDLEDVTHEVFLRVHQRWDGYDPSRPLRPWLFAFAFRLASDYRRLARHRREVFAGAEPHHAAPTRLAPAADELLEEQARLALVEAALAEVDLDRRAVLLLHDLEEIPMTQVAETLAIPVNTAYSRLRAGRKELVQAARRIAREWEKA